jgi:CheY-like chemotaxis protein
MSKILIDCGNCGPDFNAIKNMITSNFAVEVLQTNGIADTLATLREHNVQLVTVNRKLDHDYSDGLEVIKAIKADAQLSSVPVMLVTNYAEHQAEAIAAGAVLGFGKLSLQDPATIALLTPYLG